MNLHEWRRDKFMVGQDQRRGSTKAGMDWNGMDYWNGLQGSNSLLFFHTLSNRVSIASHTAMKIHGIRINGGILCENWSWCGQCMHAYAL